MSWQDKIYDNVTDDSLEESNPLKSLVAAVRQHSSSKRAKKSIRQDVKWAKDTDDDGGQGGTKEKPRRSRHDRYGSPPKPETDIEGALPSEPPRSGARDDDGWDDKSAQDVRQAASKKADSPAISMRSVMGLGTPGDSHYPEGHIKAGQRRPGVMKDPATHGAEHQERGKYRSDSDPADTKGQAAQDLRAKRLKTRAKLAVKGTLGKLGRVLTGGLVKKRTRRPGLAAHTTGQQVDSTQYPDWQNKIYESLTEMDDSTSDARLARELARRTRAEREAGSKDFPPERFDQHGRLIHSKGSAHKAEQAGRRIARAAKAAKTRKKAAAAKHRAITLATGDPETLHMIDPRNNPRRW